MRSVYTPQDGFYAARKNGAKIVFDSEPTGEQAAFAEKLADSCKEAFPRICGYLFAHEGFDFGKNAPRTADALKLSFIRIFGGCTELRYEYFLPYEDRKLSFAVDMGFTGCFETFTEIFIDKQGNAKPARIPISG